MCILSQVISYGMCIAGYEFMGNLNSYLVVLPLEFLNFDDDELTEMADDFAPDAEETRYTENSGWSSRTR